MEASSNRSCPAAPAMSRSLRSAGSVTEAQSIQRTSHASWAVASSAAARPNQSETARSSSSSSVQPRSNRVGSVVTEAGRRRSPVASSIPARTSDGMVQSDGRGAGSSGAEGGMSRTRDTDGAGQYGIEAPAPGPEAGAHEMEYEGTDHQEVPTAAVRGKTAEGQNVWFTR